VNDDDVPRLRLEPGLCLPPGPRMQVTYATQNAPGHINEDYAICGDEWAVVLDGATPRPDVDSGCIHDVPWLVRQLTAAVTRRLLLGNTELPDLLAASIEETRDAHAATCDLSNPDSPSSTISIARIRDDWIDYLVLADSPIAVRTPDQAIVPISDDRIANLPGERPYSAEFVRSRRNQPGGFWVASTSLDAAYQAVTGTMPFMAGTQIALFTDGASRLTEFYGYGWPHVFSILEDRGPCGLIALVRFMEERNPPPHGKQHDDATAVFMTSRGERPS
jgi:hypothetical protein